MTNVRRNSTDAVVGHVNLATNLTGFANGSLPFLFDHRCEFRTITLYFLRSTLVSASTILGNMTGSDAHRANATLRDTAVTSHNHTDETSLRRGHGHRMCRACTILDCLLRCSPLHYGLRFEVHIPTTRIAVRWAGRGFKTGGRIQRYLDILKYFSA